MDIIVYTADPTEVDPQEVLRAIEALGYFVASVKILERG